MQSGSSINSAMELFTPEELTRRTKDVFKNSGCNLEVLNDIEFHNCIKNLDSSKILSETSLYTKNGFNPPLITGINPTFRPVLNGIEFKETIRELIKKGKFKNLNVLNGFAGDDGSFKLVPYYGSKKNPNVNFTDAKRTISDFFTYFPQYPEKINQNFVDQIFKQYTNGSYVSNYFKTLIQMISEQYFHCPTIHLAEAYSKKNHVFLYSFEHLNPSNNYHVAYGAVHSSDVPYIYGKPFLEPVYTNEDRMLSKQMIKYFTDFVKYGTPNGIFGLDTHWPSVDKKELLIFNVNSTRIGSTFLTSNGIKRQCEFWMSYENL